MIWNETVECMDREQLREIQSIRLKKMAEENGGVCVSQYPVLS